MGVQEHYVSSARVAANAGWTVMAVMWGAAWVTLLMDPGLWRFGCMFAVTAVLAAAVAGVLQTRLYTVKVCTLIRRTSGVPLEGAGDNVHAIH